QDDAVEDIQLRDLEDVLDRADLLATRGLDRDASGESLVGDPPGVRHDPRMRAFWAVSSLLGNPMTMYSTGRMLIWSPPRRDPPDHPASIRRADGAVLTRCGGSGRPVGRAPPPRPGVRWPARRCGGGSSRRGR